MTAICGKEALEGEVERTAPFLIPVRLAITWRTTGNGIYVQGPCVSQCLLCTNTNMKTAVWSSRFEDYSLD